MKTFEQFKRASLKRAGVRKALADIDLEFRIIESMIRARINKKVTQKQLAGRIGVTQSALARFESGRINPTLSFLKKVTNGLGLQLIVK
ncbi:MAG: Xre family transcriptional regulator [Parcubacteria group bacterium GW2011_GWA2_47_21]|nr:MAG: Xre family transcriptional regulator [Parcubacteria group bacterium GW2011_GWA2_47_21]